jgi:hypothetical protein
MKYLYDFIAISISLGLIVLGTLSYKAVLAHSELLQAEQEAEISPEANKYVVVRLVTNGETFCSGVVATDYVLITAGHCVIGAMTEMMMNKQIEVRLADNYPTRIYVQPGTASQQMDTGTLLGNLKTFPHMPIATNPYYLFDRVQKAPYLISCGFPMGAELYCKRLTYVGPIEFNWLTLGQLIPGMSGGPVMLPDGTVIAVNSAVDGDHSRIAPLIGVSLQAPK